MKRWHSYFSSSTPPAVLLISHDPYVETDNDYSELLICRRILTIFHSLIYINRDIASIFGRLNIYYSALNGSLL
jgi:hypothetical protein